MVAMHIFHKLVISAHLFMKMTSWGYCVCSSGYLRDFSDWLVCDPSLKLLLPLRRRMSGKGLLEQDLSGLLLRVRFSLIYIVDLFLGQWFIILIYAGHAEFAPRVSGRDDVPTGVETDGQPPRVASCGLQSDISEVVHSRSRSRELIEQAFNDGNNHVRMRNLLILFLIGSKFYLIFTF